MFSTFAAMLRCESITPFAVPVVPDVKMSVDIWSGSILASTKSRFPASRSFSPSAMSFLSESVGSVSFSAFMSMKYLRLYGSSKSGSTDSSTCWLKTIASAWERLMRVFISSGGSFLSSGTITPVPQTVAKYDKNQK